MGLPYDGLRKGDGSFVLDTHNWFEYFSLGF